MNKWLYKQLLSPYLCGCWRDYSAQLALLSLTKKREKLLHNKDFRVVVLMNCPKHLEQYTMPFLIAKLNSKSSLKLVFYYKNKR